MKLVLVTFIVAILLMSMTSFAVSSFSTPSQGHASFSAPLAFNPLTIKNRTLSSPNAQYYGFFGHSIAVSGKLVVVGAPFETADGYTQAGHTYIFKAMTGKLVTNLTSPNAQEYGYFGYSVGMSGKLVSVGALFENASGYSEAGHAYVFNAMTGKLIATLTSPNAQSGGAFGVSVAMSGKLVSVGAEGETADGYSAAGHAYVFKAGALIANLTSTNAEEGGYFGFSAAMSGKFVTVGAIGEYADGYQAAGNAYIFYNIK